MNGKLTYTVEEAARLLGVSRGVAYEAVRTGELPSVRLCRRVLIPRGRLLALLGELEGPTHDRDTDPADEPGEVTTSAGHGRRDAG